MRRLRSGAVQLLALVVLGSACGGSTAIGTGGDGPADVAVAAGSVSQELPAPTTTVTSPPTTLAPPPTPPPPRPKPTTSTTRRPAPPPAGPPGAQAGKPYAPPPPPPGVVASGYGGYGGIATTTAHNATVSLSLYPREQYFGEGVQVGVEVKTTDFVRSIKVDMGNGTVFDVVAVRGGTCSRELRMVSGGGPYYVYPAPGHYLIRAIVTVVPCIPMAGPPELPPGAPSPFEEHTVEASIYLDQRADRPPRPVGPPPGP